MRIQQDFTNTRIAFKNKPILLTETDLLKMPHLKEYLGGISLNSPNPSPANAKKKPTIPITVQKLIKRIRTNMSRIQNDLDRIEKLGLSDEPVPSASIQTKQDKNSSHSLSSILEYKSKYYQVFTQVLSSKECTSEQCAEIMANIDKIRGDYRGEIISKLLDFCNKHKSKQENEELLIEILMYTSENAEKYYKKEKIIQKPIIKKIVDTILKTNNEKLLKWLLEWNDKVYRYSLCPDDQRKEVYKALEAQKLKPKKSKGNA